MDNWFLVPCQLHWALWACATEKGQFLYPTDQPSLLVNPVSTILTKITMDYSGYDRRLQADISQWHCNSLPHKRLSHAPGCQACKVNTE